MEMLSLSEKVRSIYTVGCRSIHTIVYYEKDKDSELNSPDPLRA